MDNLDFNGATLLDVKKLADAMEQMLDDMGIAGTSVCMAAKAQARIAFEPFRDKSEPANWLMPIEIAKRVLKECDG